MVRFISHQQNVEHFDALTPEQQAASVAWLEGLEAAEAAGAAFRWDKNELTVVA
jgi:hypothetical protein